ncbi:MAG: 30S ribosomal protein S8 [archaeon]
MALMDPIENAMTMIRNAEAASKKELTIKPASNFLGEVLKIAKDNDYIESFEKNEKEKGIMTYTVKLNGKLNICRAIKPRYAVRKNEFERYEKRYLPARDVGLIIVSTPSGLMTHTEAKKKNLGGRLIAFMY